MRIFRLTALTILAILMSSLAAEAATCLASNVRGKVWHTFVTFAGGWSRCTVQVSATTNAVVPRTGGCRTYDESIGGSPRTFNIIAGGTLNVRNTDCLVTGTIKTSLGTHTIVEARLDPGKTVIAGVGRDDNGDAWTFTAIRK